MKAILGGRFVWKGTPHALRENVWPGVLLLIGGKVVEPESLVGKTIKIEKYNETFGYLVEIEEPECTSSD